MSITRWDPWDDMLTLRDAMDQLLRESFVRPRTMLGQGGGMSGIGMPIDLRETDDDYTVTATMPGVKPEDINIQIKGDTLQISGEVRDEYQQPQTTQTEGQQGQQRQQSQQTETGQRGNWLVRERRYGRFQRSITLPTNVKADHATANFENGVLTLTLPKAEESRARSIPVRAGAGQGAQQIEAKSQTQ